MNLLSFHLLASRCRSRYPSLNMPDQPRALKNDVSFNCTAGPIIKKALTTICAGCYRGLLNLLTHRDHL